LNDRSVGQPLRGASSARGGPHHDSGVRRLIDGFLARCCHGADEEQSGLARRVAQYSCQGHHVVNVAGRWCRNALAGSESASIGPVAPKRSGKGVQSQLRNKHIIGVAHAGRYCRTGCYLRNRSRGVLNARHVPGALRRICGLYRCGAR
jgi:hypothetical protein